MRTPEEKAQYIKEVLQKVARYLRANHVDVERAYRLGLEVEAIKELLGEKTPSAEDPLVLRKKLDLVVAENRGLRYTLVETRDAVAKASAQACNRHSELLAQIERVTAENLKLKYDHFAEGS